MDEILDPETAYMLTHASDGDASQPYESAFAKARARGLHLGAAAGSISGAGVGDPTAGALPALGAQAPTLDPGTLRIPDRNLANIMSVLAALREAGELHLVAEIENEILQLGGSAFALPGRGGGGGGLDTDWMGMGGTAGDFGAPSRLDLVSSGTKPEDLISIIYDKNRSMETNNLLSRSRGGGGTDAGTDAGHDAGHDAGADAGHDAGHDAGTDAGHDAGPDASTSTHVRDIGERGYTYHSTTTSSTEQIGDTTITTTSTESHVEDEDGNTVTDNDLTDDELHERDDARAAERRAAGSGGGDAGRIGDPDSEGGGGGAAGWVWMPRYLRRQFEQPTATTSGPGANPGPEGTTSSRGGGGAIAPIDLSFDPDPNRTVGAAALNVRALGQLLAWHGAPGGPDPGRNPALRTARGRALAAQLVGRLPTPYATGVARGRLPR